MLFIAGLALFFAAHLFAALARGPRERLIARLGKPTYMSVYGLVSLTALITIVLGWPSADRTVLYVTPYGLRHAVYLLMLIALVLFAASLLPKGRIAAAAKHPMLAGIKIWAFSHLLVNGDVRSLLLFGSFLAFAVIDRIAVKRRGEPTPQAGPVMNDVVAIGVGVALWAAIYFFLHPIIAGVALRG